MSYGSRLRHRIKRDARRRNHLEMPVIHGASRDPSRGSPNHGFRERIRSRSPFPLPSKVVAVKVKA